LVICNGAGSGPREEYQIPRPRGASHSGSGAFPQPPPEAISLHGIAEAPAYKDAEAHPLCNVALRPPQRAHGKRIVAEAPALLQDALHIRRPPQARYRLGPTVNRMRPFWRRRLSTLLPVGVRIRRKNP